ncbi:hypothetical protein BC939DRAFT_453769 [Gamsiella multidivaricata]|uniref:uncharacterized protein n=1 Tax=Gamsiella multidivaricata TaxID=101098 RepID=UPI00221F6D02|nr:uncharacterized protein BC939DRAFT_453769 [Gamsiella multidivaricata]KAI7822610.1 hypothetical protein BC939DRAFT_453769 [Gamsiella multidivaricata]
MFNNINNNNNNNNNIINNINNCFSQMLPSIKNDNQQALPSPMVFEIELDDFPKDFTSSNNEASVILSFTQDDSSELDRLTLNNNYKHSRGFLQGPGTLHQSFDSTDTFLDSIASHSRFSSSDSTPDPNDPHRFPSPSSPMPTGAFVYPLQLQPPPDAHSHPHLQLQAMQTICATEMDLFYALPQPSSHSWDPSLGMPPSDWTAHLVSSNGGFVPDNRVSGLCVAQGVIGGTSSMPDYTSDPMSFLNTSAGLLTPGAGEGVGGYSSARNGGSVQLSLLTGGLQADSSMTGGMGGSMDVKGGDGGGLHLLNMNGSPEGFAVDEDAGRALFASDCDSDINNVNYTSNVNNFNNSVTHWFGHARRTSQPSIRRQTSTSALRPRFDPLLSVDGQSSVGRSASSSLGRSSSGRSSGRMASINHANRSLRTNDPPFFPAVTPSSSPSPSSLTTSQPVPGATTTLAALSTDIQGLGNSVQGSGSAPIPPLLFPPTSFDMSGLSLSASSLSISSIVSSSTVSISCMTPSQSIACPGTTTAAKPFHKPRVSKPAPQSLAPSSSSSSPASPSPSSSPSSASPSSSSQPKEFYFAKPYEHSEIKIDRRTCNSRQELKEAQKRDRQQNP